MLTTTSMKEGIILSLKNPYNDIKVDLPLSIIPLGKRSRQIRYLLDKLKQNNLFYTTLISSPELFPQNLNKKWKYTTIKILKSTTIQFYYSRYHSINENIVTILIKTEN